MTCINKGQEPWLQKPNVLEPAFCPQPVPPEPCPPCDTPPCPSPFGPGCVGWEVGPNDCPAPPVNGEVVSPLFTGTLDIRWDDPAIQPHNGKFAILGVNIYRSDYSERGPFERLNAAPVGGTFYRDYTDNAFVENEVVDWDTSWLSRGEQANDRKWVFRVKHFPMVKRSGQSIAANSPMDVQLVINNQIIPVQAVFGPTGEVTLINVRGYNFATEQWIEPTLPLGPQTAVSISYYWNRNTVRTDLDHKIWYRLTTVARDPHSPTGFLETPLDYTEPITFRQVERLDYIWREAMRRNNWVLEQGGERVKVFIKKTSGDPCWCGRDPRTLEYMQQPDSRCHVCFVPGTLVRTETGYRPIEQIQVGDRVLASDGRFHSVTQTFETPFHGDLVALDTSVTTRPVLATPEHPFLVMRGAHEVSRSCGPKCDKYIERGDGNARSPDVRQLPSGRWHSRVQAQDARGSGRVTLGTFNTQEEALQAIACYKAERIPPGHSLEWDDAVNVTLKDWLVAKWSVVEEDQRDVRVPQMFTKNTHLGMERLGPEAFLLDEDFLWMVGLYLAEGSAATRAITFALHEDEHEYQQRVMGIFSRLGYNPSLYRNTSKGVAVHVSSTTLSEWFPAWLGAGCENKQIPEELMRLPAERLRALIKGIHDGDGSKRDREITQTSELLALQIAEILHRLGEQPTVRQQRSNVLTPAGNQRKTAFCVSWAEDTLQRNNRKGRWAFKGDVLTQVRRTERVPYCGPVYNLEVEGDHTYVVHGILTHNCFGTGFIGGYEGPYDIIVAPDDAERAVRQTPTGRYVDHLQDVWTGPSPMLTQRDFIVKQTNERYSVGPVRKPSARGNVMQQHFQMKYIEENDIRYKVPLFDTTALCWPETRCRPAVLQGGAWATEYPPLGPYPVGADYQQTPMQTEKENIPNEREQRGRTPVWENTQY